LVLHIHLKYFIFRRNIFIETSINRDTDRTGVFCAFNNDIVETDYYNGALDLIGNTISDGGENEINFLSYQETITEDIQIVSTPLDLPGNVTAMLGDLQPTYGSYSYVSQTDHAYGFDLTPGNEFSEGLLSPAIGSYSVNSGIVENPERTAWFGEGSVYNLDLVSNTPAIVTATTSISVTYGAGPGAYGVIGGTLIPIAATATLIMNAGNYPFSATLATYSSAFVLDTTGEISVVNSLSVGVNPAVGATDIVLGYIDLGVASQSFVSPLSFSVEDVTVGTSEYIDFSFGTYSTDDYYISEVTAGSGIIKIEFPGTNDTASVTNYKQWRKFKMFNRLVNLIDSPNKNRMTLLLNPITYEKYSFENITISNIVQSSVLNKSFNLTTGLTLIILFRIFTEEHILHISL
jgi:hypothetical protein